MVLRYEIIYFRQQNPELSALSKIFESDLTINADKWEGVREQMLRTCKMDWRGINENVGMMIESCSKERDMKRIKDVKKLRIFADENRTESVSRPHITTSIELRQEDINLVNSFFVTPIDNGDDELNQEPGPSWR